MLQKKHSGLKSTDYAKYVKSYTEETFDAPAWLNWPGLTCFWLKFIPIFPAYFLIFKYLLSY